MSTVIFSSALPQQLLLKKRRTRWTVILVPLALVLINLSTHFLTHPVALDVFAARDLSWQIVADWTPHKRHANPNPPPAESTTTTVGSATLMGTALSLASSSTAAPTVTAGSAMVLTGTPDSQSHSRSHSTIRS